MRTLVVVQARTGSTRLPGKVLLPLCGAPALERQLERLLAARTSFELVVATTLEPQDEAVVRLCERLAVDCFRGHPTDLLDRHYQAARARGAAVVAKIPSDCPLIDPAAVDAVLGFYDQHEGQYDYVSNLHPASWPDGNDVEVLSFAALECAWREARAAHEREHTTPFLWERPQRFRIGNVAFEDGLDLSRSERFTLDYAEDYALVSAVYAALWRPTGPPFGVREVLAFLESRPDVRRLNAVHAGDGWNVRHQQALAGRRSGRVRTPGASA